MKRILPLIYHKQLGAIKEARQMMSRTYKKTLKWNEDIWTRGQNTQENPKPLLFIW